MTRVKTRFICLTGVDGTGKSTHIGEIIKHLKARGIESRYVWLRRPYLFSLILLAYCRLVGLTKYSYSGGERYGSWQFYRSKFVSTLFPWVQLLDTAIFAVLKVYLPSWLGKTIVCDRFIYDTLVDTMLAIKDHELYKKKVGRLLLSLVPSRGKTIFLDCDEVIIRERKAETVNDVYLSARRKLYLSLASYLEAPIVDTAQPFDEARKKILDLSFN